MKTYLVAVTSTGDLPCFATNVASRVDTASTTRKVTGQPWPRPNDPVSHGWP